MKRYAALTIARPRLPNSQRIKSCRRRLHHLHASVHRFPSLAGDHPDCAPIRGTMRKPLRFNDKKAAFQGGASPKLQSRRPMEKPTALPCPHACRVRRPHHGAIEALLAGRPQFGKQVAISRMVQAHGRRNGASDREVRSHSFLDHAAGRAMK